jgi:hypothetical protein
MTQNIEDIYVDIRIRFRRSKDTYSDGHFVEEYDIIYPTSVTRQAVHNTNEDELTYVQERIWEHDDWQLSFVNGTLDALTGKETHFAL